MATHLPGRLDDISGWLTRDIKRRFHLNIRWVEENIRKDVPVEKQRAVQRLWRENDVIRQELAYRGNESLDVLVARGEEAAEMLTWGEQHGIPPEAMDVRPLRPDAAEAEGQLGLFTDDTGVRALSKTETIWLRYTFMLSQEQIANLKEWALLLGIFPTVGPFAIGSDDPRPSAQTMMSMLTNVDPKRVVAALKPLL